MNSPIKYYGGKGGMFNEIINQFPPIDSYNIYVEPFAGSFAVALHNQNIKDIEIYNDLEENVYSLFKTLQNNDLFEEFKKKCDLSYYSEELREEFKEKLKLNDISIVERAFYFFYVNRTSFNGIGGFTKNMTVRRKMSKSVSDMLATIDNLSDIHQRLSHCIILHRDGIDVINEYKDKSDVFIYADPPYEQSTRTSTRYKVDMDEETHIKFLHSCIESNSKLLISGYDCELYNILTENNFTKINFDVKTISGKFTPKTKVETLWKNY
jgi:DNA adenine methylase